MKRLHRSIMVLGTILLLGLIVTAANGQEADPISLEYDPDNAVIWHGEASEWDGQYTDPGGAIFHDGQYHIFRNGFVGWPAWTGAAYHTSPDGVTWTEQGDGPVFTTDDVPFAEIAALPTTVLIEADGTWVLYFYTVGDPTEATASTFSIGRATAPDPLGPWTVHPEPVLVRGSKGAWDSMGVSSPGVVRTDDGYLMVYGGASSTGPQLIGLATSADGITWTKYDDPATTEPPFAESDPVFVGGDEGAWDAALVMQPSIIQTPDGLVMSYKSQTMLGSPRGQGYGLATSQDGITWKRYSGNPLLTTEDVQRRNLWFHELVYGDGEIVLFFEMMRGYRNQSDIYLARLSGSPFE